MPVNGDLCGNCVSCFDALKESSPHLVHLLLNGDPMVTAEAQIQQVRAAVWSRGLWPGKRVVVLVGADRVRKGAIDGLLKTVEESAALTSFIFVAQRLHEIPAALRSRCVSITLKKADSRRPKAL